MRRDLTTENGSCTMGAMESEIKTIVAFDSRSGDRTLIAEVHPHINDIPSKEELRAFETRLFDANVRTGLFITATQFVVIRDLLTSMEQRDNRYKETPLESRQLFARAGSEVTNKRTDIDKILAYLKILPHVWSRCLSSEALEAFMPDVVGPLFDAEFEVFDGNYTNYAASA